jgi:hypothetical protein
MFLFQLSDQAGADPDLNIVIVIEKAFCLFEGLCIVLASQWLKASEMAVSANEICAILCHRNAPFRSPWHAMCLVPSLEPYEKQVVLSRR